jgi:hypothetical protein
MSNQIQPTYLSSQDTALDMSAIVDFLRTHSIEETYNYLGYDYKMESEHEQKKEHEIERQAFINRLLWHSEPSHEMVRRVFNQINTFYADGWAMSHLRNDPIEFLLTSNRLVLYRQSKIPGFRTKNIAFGEQKNLDFLDLRRQFKMLRGIAPQLIPVALEDWSKTISQVTHEVDTALFLTMALITIHPFSDGNGRVARSIYTWLIKRWDLKERWLAEGEDGEVMRTGFGMDSTEHLMAAFMLEICQGYNRNKYGFRNTYTAKDEEQALISLQSQLQRIRNGNLMILKSETFKQLRDHLEEKGHMRLNSPRFEALRKILR